jgi:hypothetical protein
MGVIDFEAAVLADSASSMDRTRPRRSLKWAM